MPDRISIGILVEVRSPPQRWRAARIIRAGADDQTCPIAASTLRIHPRRVVVCGMRLKTLAIQAERCASPSVRLAIIGRGRAMRRQRRRLPVNLAKRQINVLPHGAVDCCAAVSRVRVGQWPTAIQQALRGNLSKQQPANGNDLRPIIDFVLIFSIRARVVSFLTNSLTVAGRWCAEPEESQET